VVDEYLAAIVIAIVEGLTEFLPVSSTGHMILAEGFFPLDARFASSFEIFIQLGAILAIVFLYPHRFLALIPKKNQWNFSVKGFEGLRALLLLAIACAPAFCLGAVFHSYIKTHLFNPATVAIGLIVGGIVLILVEKFPKAEKIDSVDDFTLSSAFFIGLAQCFSLWPGVSRSGATMVGGMLCGSNRYAAAEFSFLLAVPVMCAAVTLDLIKSASHLNAADLPTFGIGFLVAFFVAIVAVKAFVAFLGRIGLDPFGYYRIVIGIIVLITWR
jgi:undecaprenyl-diphosphatase